MASTYSWVITKDLVGKGRDLGLRGPRGSTATVDEMMLKGIEFRLYDGDQAMYYSGWYLGPDDEQLFGPLDDFGTPNAG